MSFTHQTLKLNDKACMTMLQAAKQETINIGQGQCIVIVDASGETLAILRTDGSKFIALKSAVTKARTAASIRAPSSDLPEALCDRFAAATGGDLTGLPGGLPIIINGECVGGIGVGSGSGDQDIAVAKAALLSIEAEIPDSV